MKNDGGSSAAKRNAGESAAELVEDDMTVGLGTGSTAAEAIRALGARVDAGLDVRGVPTSYQARENARAAGIPLTTLEDVDTLDVAIDGADQVAGRDLVKGGGAAHAREKYVDAAAERFVVVADPSKVVDVLDYPVPVEVLPDAKPVVEDTVRNLGGEPELRTAERKDGPVVTDNGNLVLDVDFGELPDPGATALDLDAIPGIVEHGVFAAMADELHVGSESGVSVETL